jgi:hypothetical protein
MVPTEGKERQTMTTTTTPGNVIPFTIQPGFLFSEMAVRSMRLAGLSDDDVAADLAELETGAVCPAELVSRHAARRGVRAYVRDLCRVAGFDLVRGI